MHKRLNQDVQHLPLLIYCTPQVLAHSVDLQIDFIQVPGITHGSTLASNLLGVLATKLFTPSTNTFIGDNDASFSNQEFHIPKAQGKSKLRPHALTDDCCSVALALVGYG
jgi:hypothetical protein